MISPRTESRLRGIVRAIDRTNDVIGGSVLALLILPLLYAVCHEVIARYLFNLPTEWAYDLVYMIYGGHFMLGAAYTLLHGGHVRTDIFYNNWSLRRRGTIDAVLYVFCFFPGMIFFFWTGLIEAVLAFQIGERSDATTWMPSLVPFKATIPVAAALLLVQGVSELIKSLYAAITGRPL